MAGEKLRNKKTQIMVATFVILLCYLLYLHLPGIFTDSMYLSSERTPLEVTFIDVGQGDSVLVMLPGDKTMLIDAGERADANKVLEVLRHKGITRLDYCIATHPHSDHIGGLARVIERLEIGRVFMPKIEHNTNTYRSLLETIKEKGLKVETAKDGVTVAEEGGYRAVFAAPVTAEYNELNNYSAVLHLTFGDTAFLFMGDAEEQSENDIYADIGADVLKVGHHGSGTSTGSEFLERVSPQIAVISCGKDNSYNHPNGEVVKKLEDRGVAVLRTDKEGDITICSDGKEIKIK